MYGGEVKFLLKEHNKHTNIDNNSWRLYYRYDELFVNSSVTASNIV